MTISHQGALGLELENDEGTMLVEFAVGDDGAFSVGSSPHAGLRIQRQGVAPTSSTSSAKTMRSGSFQRTPRPSSGSTRNASPVAASSAGAPCSRSRTSCS